MSRRGAAALLAAALAIAAAPAPPAAAAAVDVRSSLEPRRLALGQTAVYSLRVESGLTTRVRWPSELPLENFVVVGGPSHSAQIEWGGRARSRTLVVQWVLQPVAAGSARVGPVTIEIGGEPLEVPGAGVEVVAGAEPPPPEPPRAGGPGRRLLRPRALAQPEPRFDLRAEVDERRPWAGEQIAYTLWIYAQAPFREPGLAAPPRFPGFWADEVDLGDPRALAERVWLDGEVWQRLPLMRRVLFPLAPGDLEIPPLELTLEVSASPFDRFGFLRPHGRRITLASNPVTVEVRPLPPAPAGFSGAVGSFELDAAIDPAAIALGDGATLEVILAGSGNLQGVAPPEPEAPPGLALLPAEEESGRRVAGARVRGRRTWRWPLAPEEPGSYRLEPLTLTYFDPEAGDYRTASTGELALAVGEAAPAPEATADAAAPPEEAAVHRRPWLAWASGGLGATALAAAAVLLLRRRRNGNGSLRRWRREIERARAADRPRRAAALLEESWRDLLAARWRLPRELPPASWEEALREAGAPAATAAAVGALADDLQALRQAPELSAVGALTDDLIARSARIARALG